MVNIMIKASALKTVNSLLKSRCMGVSDYILRFDKKMLSVRAVNAPKTAMVEIKSKEAMTIDTDDVFDLRLTSKDVESIIKSSGKTDVDLNIVAEDGTYTFTVANVRKKIPASTDAAMIDKLPAPPKMNQKFTMNSGQLDTVLNGIVTEEEYDTCIIKFSPSRVLFSYKEMTRETDIEFPVETLKGVTITEDDRAMFQSGPFLQFLAARYAGSDVSFLVGKDMPICMEFAVPVGTARMLLAPYISNDT